MKTKLLSTSKKVCFILAFLITGLNSAFAQSPANDFCGNAATLTPFGSACTNSVTGDVAGATQSMTPILCNSNTSTNANDVWYKFVATATAHTITVVGSTSLDPVVEMLSAACGTSMSCADVTATGGTETISATGLTVGTTYFLRVYAYG